jgi:hypothetical protein
VSRNEWYSSVNVKGKAASTVPYNSAQPAPSEDWTPCLCGRFRRQTLAATSALSGVQRSRKWPGTRDTRHPARHRNVVQFANLTPSSLAPQTAPTADPLIWPTFRHFHRLSMTAFGKPAVSSLLRPVNGKPTVHLCQEAYHAGVWGSGDRNVLGSNGRGVEWSASRSGHFTLGETTSGSHCRGG